MLLEQNGSEVFLCVMDMSKAFDTKTQHSIQKVIGSGYAMYCGICINILLVTKHEC